VITLKIEPPRRARHTYVQHLAGTPAQVFPLLCPVRECDWASDWAPMFVASVSGYAEPDCVFVTPAEPHDAIWYVTRHEPDNNFVEMLKISPEVTACRLTIQLRPALGGCTAEVTYCHTSLGPAGDRFVAAFTADHYARFMQAWESELNGFLRRTG
jgi:hypothetical protein